MTTEARIDRYLGLIRQTNASIETKDREIAAYVAARNQDKEYAAELQGRIAFLEGKKRGRNPFSQPLARCWNTGYDAERAETLEACADVRRA